MKKRILSLLLALALLCAMLPQIALPARADDACSGTCGDNLTWRFDPGTGTLTIEGSGNMDDFDLGEQPWTAYEQDITKVTLPDGLTEIGRYAFAYCTGLTSVTFPDALTEIGYYAFYHCTGLTSVNFPAGLTEIGKQTFDGCTGLTSITFPDGLTSIGSWAFCGCTGLTGITLPAGLTKIREGAFSGCTGLRSFSVAAENPSFSTDACGVLLNKDKTELVCYPGGRTGSYAIPQSVTFVGEYAFVYCTGLTEITLPDGLTEIGRSAFDDCTGLTEITFPAGLTSIGDLAFDGCTGLTSITFPDGLTSIGSRAFSDCTGLKVFSVAGGNPNYSSDASGVLFNKDKTQLIQYPSGRSGSYTVPNSVTFIGSWAFYHCTGLTQITFPAGLTSIGNDAFAYCTGLTQLTLPDGLTEIGYEAFAYCTGLTQLTLPDALTEIGEGAFYGCTGLTAFSVASANPNFSSKAGVVFNKKGTELILYPCGRTGAYTVPAGVTSIGNDAFAYCTGLTQLTLPAGLTEIGWAAFEGCTGLTQITFPAGLTSIGGGAFYGCTGLTQLTLPDGLTEIGYEAFAYCTGLTQLTFPTGLTYIGAEAFEGCTGMTQLTLPAGLTEIDWRAFSSCTGLTDVVIPASVTKIEEYAFGYWWDDDDANNYKPIAGFKIYGYKETAAQTYAQKNGFRFIPLDPQSGFADVKPKQYYYNAMLWALEHGITSGTSRVTFSPNDTCTRGQVMTFLYAAKGKPEANWDNNPFVDVKKSKFYYKPVLWAVQNGITSGMDATHFQPNGGCTRAQVVTFLWALSGKPNPAEGSNPFKDVKKSNWYYKAVLWASQNGITRGVDDTHFGPNQICTRGQVVTFLYALLGK